MNTMTRKEYFDKQAQNSNTDLGKRLKSSLEDSIFITLMTWLGVTLSSSLTVFLIIQALASNESKPPHLGWTIFVSLLGGLVIAFFIITVASFHDYYFDEPLQGMRIKRILNSLYKEYKDDPSFMMSYYDYLYNKTREKLHNDIPLLYATQKILMHLPDEISIESTQLRITKSQDLLDQMNHIHLASTALREAYQDSDKCLTEAYQILHKTSTPESIILCNKIEDGRNNFVEALNSLISRVEDIGVQIRE